MKKALVLKKEERRQTSLERGFKKKDAEILTEGNKPCSKPSSTWKRKVRTIQASEWPNIPPVLSLCSLPFFSGRSSDSTPQLHGRE